MDICLYGKNHGYSPEKTAEAAQLTPEQVVLVYKDIDVKRATTGYLHSPPILAEKVLEINPTQ
jgi:NAD+ synthase